MHINKKTMIKTQHQVIREKLIKDGSISNVWAVNHYIFRLSERIRELVDKGWNFEKHYLKRNGRRTNTYVYDLVGTGE